MKTRTHKQITRRLQIAAAALEISRTLSKNGEHEASQLLHDTARKTYADYIEEAVKLADTAINECTSRENMRLIFPVLIELEHLIWNMHFQRP